MRNILFFLALVLLYFPQTLSAREHEPKALPELVVTATGEPTPARELPVCVQVIGKKEIQKSGAENLSGLLVQKLSGHFHKYPGANTSAGIRGFRSARSNGADFKDQVLVLIDGHRAGTGNISLIPLGNVERVEIVRGPGSVLYGAGAMGGVINVITRKGRGKVRINQSAEYGSFDHKKLQGGISGGAYSDRIGYSFAVRAVEQGDYSTGRGDTYTNTEYNDHAASGSLTLRPVKGHEVSLTGNYFKARTGDPWAFYSRSLDTTVEDLHRYFSLTYDGSVPSRELNWRLNVYDIKHDYESRDPDGSSWYTLSVYDTSMQGAGMHFGVPTFSFGRLVFGGESSSIEEKHRGEGGGGVYSPDAGYDTWALFAEETIDVGGFTFLFGGRYDDYEEEIKETSGLTVTPTKESFSHWSWRGGATWWALDWLSMRMAVGTAFRPPTADEFAGRYQTAWTKYIGNHDLDPESSITYEAGLDMEYDAFGAGLTYFHTEYKDRIQGDFLTTVDGDPTWRTWKNIDGRVLAGVEGYADYRKTVAWKNRDVTFRPYVNWTYFTERKEKDDSVTAAMGTDTVLYVDEYNLRGGLEIDCDKWAVLDLNALWTGPQKVQDWDTASPNYMQVINKDGFVVCSARLTVTPREHFRAYLAVDNLLNESYEFVHGYPMPGRAVTVGIACSF